MSENTKMHNIQNVQNEINECTNIMKSNIEKVLDRDQKLNDIESNSEALLESSHRFEKKTNKLKWKYYCTDKRFLISLILMLIFIIIILVAIFSKR